MGSSAYHVVDLNLQHSYWRSTLSPIPQHNPDQNTAKFGLPSKNEATLRTVVSHLSQADLKKTKPAAAAVFDGHHLS